MIHLYEVLGVTRIHDYFLAMFFVRQTDQIHLQSPFLSSLSVYDEGTERRATLLRFGHLYTCRRCKELIPVLCLNWGRTITGSFYQSLLDDDLDLLDLRFLFSTGEHFRFLHDDPMVDYLRTSNSLRPASPVCGTLQGKPWRLCFVCLGRVVCCHQFLMRSPCIAVWSFSYWRVVVPLPGLS